MGRGCRKIAPYRLSAIGEPHRPGRTRALPLGNNEKSGGHLSSMAATGSTWETKDQTVRGAMARLASSSATFWRTT